MAGEKQVHIAISGTLQYEAEIALSKATQIITFIESGAPINSTLAEAAPNEDVASPSKRGSQTAHQAIANSKAKTNAQKIVALVNNGPGADGSEFKAEDISPLFKQARETMPKNISRDIGSAVKSGWLADGDESGTYYVTNEGEQAVENGFSES